MWYKNTIFIILSLKNTIFYISIKYIAAIKRVSYQYSELISNKLIFVYSVRIKNKIYYLIIIDFLCEKKQTIVE